MRYGVVEISWDDCWYNFLALFDTREEAQDIVLSLFQEEEYFEFCVAVQYPLFEEDTIEYILANFRLSGDCEFDVVEVPCFGS